MVATLFVMFVFMIPFIMIMWSFIKVKEGKSEKVAWKKPLLLLLVLLLITVAINLFYTWTYHIPFFQRSSDFIVATIIVGSIILVMVLIKHYVSRGLPKSEQNSNTFWKVTGAIALILSLFFIWLAPFGQKTNYVINLNNAVQALDSQEQTEELSVILVESERDCNGDHCTKYRYNNIFFVKNHLNETKEVQVKIRALDHNKNELKTIDSLILLLEPNEIRMIETEETIENINIWDKYSFKTESPISSYEYVFHYKNID